MDAPVVEHLRNVDDLLAALAGPQHQVVILRTIEAGAEAADVLDDGSLVSRQMADVVGATDAVGRPGGLEDRVAAILAGFVEFVLVAEDQPGVGILIDGLGDREQGKRR